MHRVEFGAPSRIRTCTALGLNELPPAGWAIGAEFGARTTESNLGPSAYRAVALPAELYGHLVWRMFLNR